MKRDKKKERLAELAQLLALYQGFTGSEQEQALKQQQMDFLTQEQPLRARGLEADISAREQSNAFAQQLQPHQLQQLIQQITAGQLANEQTRALNPINVRGAQANASMAESQAQQAQKLLPFVVPKAEQDIAQGRSALESSRVQQEHAKSLTQGQLQQNKFGVQDHDLLRQRLAAEIGAMTNPSDIPAGMRAALGADMMQQQPSSVDLSTLMQPRVQQPMPGGQPQPVLDPFQQAVTHANMFNSGKLEPWQLGQFGNEIMQGMQAQPQYNWPEMFRGMQYYNNNPGLFSGDQKVHWDQFGYRGSPMPDEVLQKYLFDRQQQQMNLIRR